MYIKKECERCGKDHEIKGLTQKPLCPKCKNIYSRIYSRMSKQVLYGNYKKAYCSFISIKEFTRRYCLDGLLTKIIDNGGDKN